MVMDKMVEMRVAGERLVLPKRLTSSNLESIRCGRRYMMVDDMISRRDSAGCTE